MRALTLDKLTPPPARDPGPEPHQEWLDISLLVIDPEYQREIGKDGRAAIERIAAGFEWSKFSPVIVSPVSLGRYAIIDGQHRTTAALLIGIKQVPCYVIALDRAGQAASFAAINGSVTRITPWHVYRAALAAGEAWALQARSVAEAAGCKLMTSNKSASQKVGGEIYGVTTMREMIERYGPAAVTTALASYKQSVYGDLALAWTNQVLFAWVQALAGNETALGLPVSALATFHDGFDLLEADDEVQADRRAAIRRGEKPLAHMPALIQAIADALASWLATNRNSATNQQGVPAR